tara:strand:+ start:4136 stop:4633 length:498 start_codon:yes stop_codon:yes gene_type:complete
MGHAASKTIATKNEVESESKQECFVCLTAEGKLLTNLCKCTDRAVHLGCQRKMLQRGVQRDVEQQMRCPVCKSKYANVRLEKRRQLSRSGVLAITGGFSSTLTGMAAITEFYVFSSVEDAPWALCVAVVCVVLSICMAIVTVGRMQRVGWPARSIFEERQRVVLV